MDFLDCLKIKAMFVGKQWRIVLREKKFERKFEY